MNYCLRSVSVVPLLIFLVFLYPSARTEKHTSNATILRPEHKAVVDEWLSKNPRRSSLRVANDKDCLNKEGLRNQRRTQRYYQPYYATGDFNHDGKEDFAVAFVNDRRRRERFSFAIFNGPFQTNHIPAYEEDNVDLSRWVFFWDAQDKASDNYLLLGEFESDSCVMYRPKGKRYEPRPCIEE